MTRHALLLRANANRVFGASSFGLAIAELDLLGRRALRQPPTHVEQTVIGGVDYLVVDTSAPLDDHDLSVVSNLSSLHALFEVDGDRFRPITPTVRRVLDEDLTTIQRYVGKTNEAFTHLLVNVALAAGDGSIDRLLAGARLRLLDPACGRGTTLHRAALYGMDAVGVDLDERSIEAYDTFFTTWLKDKRLKHRVERATLRKGRATPAHRVTFTYGHGRDLDDHRKVEVVHDDTRGAAAHLRARSIDVLACDLPYGVQHGSTAAAGRRDRGPEGLLGEALPVWRELLRPGAGVALAWNRNTLPRPRLEALVMGAGLELLDGPEDAFLHRVDRSIERDVLVGRRPRT